MTDQFDLIVVGAGNAGMAAAGAAHADGKSVAIIEDREFGGTCPNRGCTPKKVLVAAANALETLRQANNHGITVDGVSLDWTALIQRKRDLISFIPEAMEEAAHKRATVYKGRAKFQAPNKIAVGDKLIEAENIVVATGSRPRSLPFEGAETLATSDDLLDLPSVPEHVVFVGGGVIALEFSHVLVRAGAKVTVLEALPRLLPRMDADAVNELRRASESVGINFVTNVSVDKVVRASGSSVVTYTKDKEEFQLAADIVVNGAGRVPNIDDLNLEAGNVETLKGAIKVDSQFRSISNPGVYVAGDALVETPQLSPLASTEGRDVAKNIYGGASVPKVTNVIPQAIYSIPTLASVGLTEVEARQLYPRLVVQSTDLSGWFSAKTHAEETAWAKIIIDQDTDNIIGAHLIGHHGEELIHLFAFAMNNDINANALKSMTFAFPTFASDIKNLW